LGKSVPRRPCFKTKGREYASLFPLHVFACVSPPPSWAIFVKTSASCLRSNEMYGFGAPSQPTRKTAFMKQQVDGLMLWRLRRGTSGNPYISFDLKHEAGYFGKMRMYRCCFRLSDTISPFSGRKSELCVHYTCGWKRAKSKQAI